MAPTKQQGPKEKFLKKVQSFSDTLYHWQTVLNTLVKRFGLANPLLASQGGPSFMDFVDC
jgi:hypothetical protein